MIYETDNYETKDLVDFNVSEMTETKEEVEERLMKVIRKLWTELENLKQRNTSWTYQD